MEFYGAHKKEINELLLETNPYFKDPSDCTLISLTPNHFMPLQTHI